MQDLFRHAIADLGEEATAVAVDAGSDHHELRLLGDFLADDTLAAVLQVIVGNAAVRRLFGRAARRLKRKLRDGYVGVELRRAVLQIVGALSLTIPAIRRADVLLADERAYPCKLQRMLLRGNARLNAVRVKYSKRKLPGFTRLAGRINELAGSPLLDGCGVAVLLLALATDAATWTAFRTLRT